jgi:hypothetical protein
LSEHNVNRSDDDDDQRLHKGNDSVHTHAYDAVQGAETAAAAKLEKKNEDESNAARTPRSDMITD